MNKLISRQRRAARGPARGFTLIELMVVLVIITALYGAWARQKQRADDRTMAEGFAGHIGLVGKALESYISNNSSALGAAPSTSLTVAQLQAAGTCNGTACLDPSFIEATSWSASYTIRVQRLGAAPYQFEALICTTNPVTVAGKVRLDMVGDAVGKLGVNGGLTDDTTGATGFKGTWFKPVATYPIANTPGKLCYLISQTISALDQQYLRIDGGNRMLAQLDLNNHALVNGTTIDASGQITGGTLTSRGDVQVGDGRSITSNGRLHIQAGETLYLQPFSNAAGSMVSVGGGGGSGTLQAAGTVTANNLVSNVDLSVANNATVGNTVAVQNDVTIAALLTRASPSSTTSVKAMLPTLVEMGSWQVYAHGTPIPVPVCEKGVPRTFVFGQTVRGQVIGGNWGGDVRAAGPENGPWTVVALDSQNNPMPNAQNPTFQGLARTFCSL